MYFVRDIQVGKDHPLYHYCDNATKATNNMSNAALFRIRQVMTATQKDESEWTANEREVMDEIRNALPLMSKKHHMPTAKKWCLSAAFLQSLMVHTKNPDYYDGRISSQTAQHAITVRCQEMKSYLNSVKDCKKHPEKYKEIPKLPRYHKKGGNCTAVISNQDCSILEGENGMCLLKFPYTGQKLEIGKTIAGRLKQVNIVPEHGIFHVMVTTEVSECAGTTELLVHRRICNIDVGVNNLAAVTNNIGMPCILLKGGVIKSANQWYNKRMAKIQSDQTKGGTERFVMTPEAHELCVWRDNQIDDYLHKSAKYLISWCKKNDIDTIVYGKNKDWKQESGMGKLQNQNFVQIPFERFCSILSYLCMRAGICFIAREESYTSQASFPDLDYIPTYGVDDEKADFSGKRCPTQYKGNYKKNGFHGLYQPGNGAVINADLNGSANIGRKTFPDMYDSGLYPEFNDVVIISHPDADKIKQNREEQKQGNTGISRSKQKRLRRKGKLPA